MAKGFWLMKSEPSTFSIDDLEGRPGGVEPWDGVRNYQARNFLRDAMKKGDRALFYHSGREPAVVGTMTIVTEGYPDATARNPDSDHYDPRSTPESPIWYVVDVRFDRRFPRPVTLKALRLAPGLAGLQLLQRGNRLSVMPISREAFETIVKMGRG